MPEPIAYFLTWPTYGTHLHGDRRGSVDREHNAFGTPSLGPDPRRTRWESLRRKSPPVTLPEPSRRVVDSVIRDHCRHRSWDLLALSVRTNHVHVVVASCDRSPEHAMSELKAWATRRLREQSLVDREARVWAHHGSTRYLWDAQSVNGAIAYVTDGQDVPR